MFLCLAEILQHMYAFTQWVLFVLYCFVASWFFNLFYVSLTSLLKLPYDFYFGIGIGYGMKLS